MNEIITQVDSERIYQHILKLEGPKHPIDTPEKLNEAADYILEKFEQYGLQVREQEFKVEGFDATFRNVEGWIGEENGSQLLLVSHYDTVAKSPGANDNLSGVAVMLEAACILAREKNVGNVHFISFSLEEGNPAYESNIRGIARDLGLRDEQNRHLSLHTSELLKKHIDIWQKAITQVTFYKEAYLQTIEQLKSQMTENELEYFKELNRIYGDYTKTTWVGQTALMGSNAWVKEAAQAKKSIRGVLCLETMGYTSNKKYSQAFPEGLDITAFKSYKVDEEQLIGNFITLVADENSSELIQSFCAQCEQESIDLPYLCLQVPLQFDQIGQVMPDLLRSDHAPFWRESIPGIMLTDTANFRYPYYHTPADTIDKLDFSILKKICQAAIGTIIDLAEK